MSYDIYLMDNTQHNERVCEESFNITWNVGKMFYSWSPQGIRLIYGMTGRQSLMYLLDLHNYLIENYDKMVELEPSNGYGSWENTVKCINKMCIVAARHPECVWEGD